MVCVNCSGRALAAFPEACRTAILDVCRRTADEMRWATSMLNGLWNSSIKWNKIKFQAKVKSVGRQLQSHPNSVCSPAPMHSWPNAWICRPMMRTRSSKRLTSLVSATKERKAKVILGMNEYILQHVHFHTTLGTFLVRQYWSRLYQLISNARKNSLQQDMTLFPIHRLARVIKFIYWYTQICTNRNNNNNTALAPLITKKSKHLLSISASELTCFLACKGYWSGLCIPLGLETGIVIWKPALLSYSIPDLLAQAN